MTLVPHVQVKGSLETTRQGGQRPKWQKSSQKWFPHASALPQT